ncbi:disease resistance protein RGA2-like [Ananas comosus]|uniref:Disease resistance protein RGA2-like n=2 Tax=Ananas comosus TaxID=4615 RepID=A0A6P5EUB3_ANACO|nr:disease resistance protein RGA2-like [Ananas comosus]XP_020084755.1 disease resistance protein RGA2-like [Ananas comosus]XP_020084756.1 disease resistance protein RGA2-like [Ananas comosus]XP_020084757.1 disease resistance protein RGA2-like [Ananas comosus]XP_020084758.1 disease resistance protein RGA2-like [Ananas comosus]CAD1841000.1 unnamed protein product [Ananas comosus var. bracteatus]
MGWLLSFAKEVVQSAAASVVADELVRLLPCLDHDLEVLRTTLLTTRLRVDNAEQWRFKNAHFDQLLMQLKAAYYDAEDLIAEFDYVELQQKIEGQASLLLSSSLDFVKNLISRAPDKVRQYQRRLDDAAAALEKVIVDLNFRDEPKRSDVLRRRQTGSFVTEPEVFGRDEEREKVIALLLRPGDESGRPSNSESVPAKRMKTDNVSVLPIVGIGGMGKTTLAQVVFNDPRVRHYFETRIWICVSEIFDVKRLTKEVISNVDLRHQTDGKNSSLSRTNRKNLTLYQTGGKNFSSLQVVLNEIATSKRFLLVLDDVWNEDKMEWDKFYAPMRSGYRGSMILTTTRSSKVADIMGTMDSIFLEGLPDDSFWEFFKTCAFGYGNEKLNQELESIAKKIATKLKGTPLAAKTVGGLLKEKMDANHWRSIMNSEMWKLRQGENDIFPALQLSYQYLPPHLKRCFSICSIFPKDYEIDEVSLIELWVAQGFVTSEDNMLPKDVATRYLGELTSRSFLRLRNPNKRYYVIHNLMHDLARSVSAHEVLMVQNNKCEQSSPSSVRHLAILGSYLESSMLKEIGRYSRLRSVLSGIFSGHWSPTYLYFNLTPASGSWFTQLRYIRLLDISRCAIKELPESIDNLKLLQYLNISDTAIGRLPNSLCCLYNLRVLNLDGCPLQSIPKGFIKLINLQNLYMGQNLFSQVAEIGKLTSLQNLPRFEVRKENGHRIAELKDLTQLRRTLCIKSLENVESQEDACQAKLCEKKNLDELVLGWYSNRNTNPVFNDFPLHEKVLEGLSPHRNLRKLEIISYYGNKHPSWLQREKLPFLTSVRIQDCPNLKDICYLPRSLELLVLESVGWESLPKLWDEDSPVEGIRSGSMESSSLSYLSINSCSNLTSLYEWLLPLYLPALKSINIVDCTKLTALHIERFKEFLSLERLEIKNCPKLASQEELFLPSSLLSLHINSCGDLDKSFPSCLQNLTSLMDLDLFNCQHIESLPSKFLGNLTSLKLLRIVNCPELRSLGGSGALTSLQELTILECPRLTETEPMMYVNRVWRKDDPVTLVVVIDNTTLLQLPFFRNLLPSTMSLKIQNSLESLIFVEDSNEWLQILASVRYLSFEHCSNLRSLPAWLRSSTSLQLRMTDCPKIDLLPSLPATL